MFLKHKVLTKAEVLSRYEISLEEYNKVINIEALTLIDMINKYIIPFSLDYTEELVNIYEKKKSLKIKYDIEKDLLDRLTSLTNNLYKKLRTLEDYLSEAKKIKNISKSSIFFRDKVLACIEDMRPIIDELEKTVSKKYWKLPTYGDMLYSLA